MNLGRRNLLVTGGAGFIGSNFVHHWRGARPADTLVVLDALTYAGNRMSLASLEGTPGYAFVHGDICDQDLVEKTLRIHGIDTVVHFAAESHVDRSILGPDKFVETNIVGTHALLKACRQVWLIEGAAPSHRFHHVSTDEVFGSLGPLDPPFREDTPYAPNSPYAASKAASDHLVRAYAHTFGLQVSMTNCSNNYGPYQFPEKLIPLAIVNLLQGRAVPIYGDGKNVRDWLHVSDHCRAIELVLEQGLPGATFNVGGVSERTNVELIILLCSIVDEAFARQPELAHRFPDCPPARGRVAASAIEFVRDRPGHDRRYAIDGRRITGEFGFSPAWRLPDGLRATLAWYLENEPWWRSVMDGSYRSWVVQQYGSPEPA